jgi:hypothetical protein
LSEKENTFKVIPSVCMSIVSGTVKGTFPRVAGYLNRCVAKTEAFSYFPL